jgi:hypothetical protein
MSERFQDPAPGFLSRLRDHFDSCCKYPRFCEFWPRASRGGRLSGRPSDRRRSGEYSSTRSFKRCAGRWPQEKADHGGQGMPAWKVGHRCFTASAPHRAGVVVAISGSGHQRQITVRWEDDGTTGTTGPHGISHKPRAGVRPVVTVLHSPTLAQSASPRRRQQAGPASPARVRSSRDDAAVSPAHSPARSHVRSVGQRRGGAAGSASPRGGRGRSRGGSRVGSPARRSPGRGAPVEAAAPPQAVPRAVGSPSRCGGRGAVRANQPPPPPAEPLSPRGAAGNADDVLAEDDVPRMRGAHRRLARAELSESDAEEGDEDGNGAPDGSEGGAAAAEIADAGDRLAPNGQEWTPVRDLPLNPPLQRRETTFTMDHVLQGHEPTLVDYFKAYFPCSEIERIVTATKAAAKGKLSNLSGDEFLRFLGVLLAIGLCKGAVPRDRLWERASLDSVRPAYDFNRFGMSHHRCGRHAIRVHSAEPPRTPRATQG